MALLEKSNIDAKDSTNVMKASSSVANIGGKFYADHSRWKYDDTSWIVDTCATHHICHDIGWFTTYNEIKPISVNLTIANTVEAHCKGKVKISKSLHIDDVLYLPQFAVNLISVSKLCKEQHYSVTFETNQCII